MIRHRWAGAAGAAAVVALLFAPFAQAQTGAAGLQAGEIASAAPETAGFSSEKLADLNMAMHRAVNDGDIAGIATMLVRHGHVVNLDLYGKKSVATGAPMTRDTIFRMYSQTKPLTGVAMMILYEQGKWKLEDPVTKFIPEFAKLKVMTGLDDKGQPILEDMKHPPTMRELMTHSAGFGYGLRSDNYVDKQFQTLGVLRSNSLQELVDKIATIPLLYQPGTRWSYSAAADIQGYIIEKLSGQRLGDFMAEHIFKPLGMNDTGFSVPVANASRLASVYVRNAQTGGMLFEITTALPMVQDFTKTPPMDSGGGGSVSTLDDYGRFCQMILNSGELNGVRILSPATVQLMETDALESTVVPDSAAAIGGDAVGFGLDFAVTKDPAKLGSSQGKGSIWWGGAAGTWFWIDPQNRLFFLGMIQKFGGGNAGNEKLVPASVADVYSALTDPSK